VGVGGCVRPPPPPTPPTPNPQSPIPNFKIIRINIFIYNLNE